MRGEDEEEEDGCEEKEGEEEALVLGIPLDETWEATRSREPHVVIIVTAIIMVSWGWH